MLVPLQCPASVWSVSVGLLRVWTQSALSSSFWIIPQMLFSSNEHWSSRVIVLAGTGQLTGVNLQSLMHYREGKQEQNLIGQIWRLQRVILGKSLSCIIFVISIFFNFLSDMSIYLSIYLSANFPFVLFIR